MRRVFDRLLFSGGRDWVCERASGMTLEVAIGTGRNLGRYPAGVRLTGIDASAAMLARAQRRADYLETTVVLREGDAECLAFPDDCFDSVVVTLALCTIPDDGAAVAEMARVLRPGGKLLALEHTASPRPLIRAVQGLANPLAGRSALGITLRLGAHKPGPRASTPSPPAVAASGAPAHIGP